MVSAVFCAKSLYMYGRFRNWEVSAEKALYMYGQFSNWEVSLKIHCIGTVVFIIGKYNENHCVGTVGT